MDFKQITFLILMILTWLFGVIIWKKPGQYFKMSIPKILLDDNFDQENPSLLILVWVRLIAIMFIYRRKTPGFAGVAVEV